MSFSQIYRPKYDKEKNAIDPPVVGCSLQMSDYAMWLGSWSPGRVVLFCGRSGCGKGVVAEVVANAKGYATEERDVSEMEKPKAKKKLSEYRHPSVASDKTVIVLRGLEAAVATSANMSIIKKAITEYAKTHPVVLIADEAGSRSIADILSRTIKFGAAMWAETKKLLDGICVRAGIDATIANTATIARGCQGDVRHALLTLQFGANLRDASDKDVWYTPTDAVYLLFRGGTEMTLAKVAEIHYGDPITVPDLVHDNVLWRVRDAAAYRDVTDDASTCDSRRLRDVQCYEVSFMETAYPVFRTARCGEGGRHKISPFDQQFESWKKRKTKRRESEAKKELNSTF